MSEEEKKDCKGYIFCLLQSFKAAQQSLVRTSKRVRKLLIEPDIIIGIHIQTIVRMVTRYIDEGERLTVEVAHSILYGVIKPDTAIWTSTNPRSMRTAIAIAIILLFGHTMIGARTGCRNMQDPY